MARRKREMEEAFGPILDGTEDVESLARQLEEEAQEELEEEDEVRLPQPEEPQTVLICGHGPVAQAVGRLAAECDFIVDLARQDEPDAEDVLAELASVTYVLDGYDDFVVACDVDRNHYVCIFAEEADICEHILSQCMMSEAAYLGVDADMELAQEIFAHLRANGVPDAELAAICCPMGLNLDVRGAEQKAVCIVAELLAAKSGVLKRLRFGD